MNTKKLLAETVLKKMLRPYPALQPLFFLSRPD